MTVVELDGYVAALIVCPDMILPSEWLPGVWGEDHEFTDAAAAEATITAVMEHYNRTAKELAERPEEYAPVLEIDPNSGETLWEPWIDGFERAMRLRPDAWEEIAVSRGRGGGGIGQHGHSPERGFYYGRSEMTEEAEDKTRPISAGDDPRVRAQSERLDQVPANREAQRRRHRVPCRVRPRRSPCAFGRKVGRNEPCPCGSGRKYKRCCGAH